MGGLYKQLSATYNDKKFKIILSNDNKIMTVKTTLNMHPKNRRQKKVWKLEASEFKKVSKGLYAVTQCCSFNTSVFAKMIELLDKDENGNVGFNLEKCKVNEGIQCR